MDKSSTLIVAHYQLCVKLWQEFGFLSDCQLISCVLPKFGFAQNAFNLVLSVTLP